MNNSHRDDRKAEQVKSSATLSAVCLTTFGKTRFAFVATVGLGSRRVVESNSITDEVRMKGRRREKL